MPTAGQRGEAAGPVRRILVGQLGQIDQALLVFSVAQHGGDQPDGRVECSPAQPRCPEGGQRKHGHAVRRARLPLDRPAPDAQRQIGDAECQLPVLAQQPLMRRVDQVGGGSGRRDEPVDDQRHSPLGVRI